MKELTSRQKKILDFIEKEISKGKPFPSYSEIGKKFDITKPGVARHIHALEKKGFVNRSQERISSFALSEDQAENTFPLAARIAAGSPAETFESNEQVSFGHTYFGGGKITALTVAGDSMTGDFISDGDVVLIRHQNQSDSRHIFAVRVEGEITLKRLKKKGAKVELIPSNPDYPTQSFTAKDVEIIGRFVGLVRSV